MSSRICTNLERTSGLIPWTGADIFAQWDSISVAAELFYKNPKRTLRGYTKGVENGLNFEGLLPSPIIERMTYENLVYFPDQKVIEAKLKDLDH